MQNRGRERFDNMEVHKNYVNGRGVRRRRKRDEKKLYCQNPLSSHSVPQKGSALSCAPLSSTSRGATFSPFSSLFFFPPLSFSPFLALSHPESLVTAIYFPSAPLYDCSHFAFMLDGLPKRLSDKAMNTLSAFSLLVSLRSAGQ